ncbi:hypothetical protein TNIN_226931 [Trichonephila inaurata madagascariensis]|uniref:Ig-like domain-containing protein n=1 Tax=Trichonephila inaurata madagascariensis TaxID=2747483 RepID=A0A8X6XVV1_9ARAC|nr:hypothetical protein TNIN_226931 [Trichonephila inaurata madagascariensis]
MYDNRPFFRSIFSTILSFDRRPPPKGPEPQFADVIPNVTVAAGRDVTLPCVVDNLGDYKVRLTLFIFRIITDNLTYSLHFLRQ